jgi:hypothetical protein
MFFNDNEQQMAYSGSQPFLARGTVEFEKNLVAHLSKKNFKQLKNSPICKC